MRRMFVFPVAGLIAWALMLPSGAAAEEGADIKAQHREAARQYLDNLAPGITLRGTVMRNDSPGQFTAHYYNDTWWVKEVYGGLEWLGYSPPGESWSGSNYGLPYKLEAEDGPAHRALELITDGLYLEEPYWEHFHYVGEDAGGYNFRFTPPDLPPVELALYSDPAEPEYLQVMSLELPMADHDPACVHYRGYYYYHQDEAGRILPSRETGREIDAAGESINFVDFVVEDTERLDEAPAEMAFNVERKPFSEAAAALDAPVVVPIRIDQGYFMVPVTFEGSEETHWFILDTGASSSLFTPETADAAALEPSLTLPTHGHGSRTEFALGLCTTAALGEADAEQHAPLAGFSATRVPEGSDVLEAMRFYGAAGILGVAPLHQYVTTFDHHGGTITFIPPQLFDAEQVLGPDTYVIDLDVEDLIYCDARLNDEFEGEVVIDSGLQQDLALLRETLDYYGLELEKVDERSNTVVGGVMSFDYVVVPSFELLTAVTPEGHTDLRMESGETPVLASVSEDDHGTLSARKLLGFVGMTLFLDVKVTLDLFGQEMYFEVPADMVVSEEASVGEVAVGIADRIEAGEEEEDDGGGELPVDID